MTANGFIPATRYCIVHSTPLYRVPKEDASEVVGHLSYMDPVRLVKDYPENNDKKTNPYQLNKEERAKDTAWALVCYEKPNSKSEVKSYRGWTPRRYLIDRLVAERDPKTQIEKKAFVVTTGKGGGQTGKVQPQLAPKPLESFLIASKAPAAPVTPDTLNLYRLFFVYATYEDWLLISPDPSQTATAETREHQQFVLGWVPSNRVAPWNTRECFQWNQDTYTTRGGSVGAGKLFLNVDDALAYQKAGTLPMENKFLKEPQPLRRRSDAMRFHLLLSPEMAQVYSMPRALEWNLREGNTENKLFQVGAVMSNNAINDRLDGQKSKIAEKAREVANTEILFVIDDTGSMRYAKDVVGDVVELISQEFVKNRGKGDVRIGISYYHDGNTPKQRADTQLAKMQSISSETDLGLLVRSVRAHNLVANAGSSMLECVYDGIYQGIENAGFQKDSRENCGLDRRLW